MVDLEATLRSFVKGRIEPLLAKVVGKVFWPPVSVAVLAYGENDDILALRNGDSYELPGGLVKHGENLRETARRELKEETGFDARVENLLDIRIGEKYGNIEFFFEAEVTGGELDGSWEGKPEFIPAEEIREKAWKLQHSHIHDYLFPEEDSGK